MSFLPRSGIPGGHYDKEGKWARTKFCFVACPPDVCTCIEPHLRWINDIDWLKKKIANDPDLSFEVGPPECG
jgi:hypothetical protein